MGRRSENLSHTHVPSPNFPTCSAEAATSCWALSLFPLWLWLCASLHRRYQGNWQWLKICSIIEARPVWLKGLGSPPFETNPSSEAISDIQFVLKLSLRVPQGPDLINIFYGELLECFRPSINNSQSLLWLTMLQQWQWGLTAVYERPIRERQTSREVTGIKWDADSRSSRGLCLIVQIHWQLGHASLRLIRSDSCKRVTMLHWVEFVSFTLLSITYQWYEPHCK